MGLCCTLSPSLIILDPEENCQNYDICSTSSAGEPIFNSLELIIFINRVSIVMFKFSCNMLPDPKAKLY